MVAVSALYPESKALPSKTDIWRLSTSYRLLTASTAPARKDQPTARLFSTINQPNRRPQGTRLLQTNTASKTRAPSVRTAVVLAALGVVFGDIGTSPIYTVQTVFNPRDPRPVPLNIDNVYGIVSLIFWSIMVKIGRAHV